jgi:hypothetical protein
MESNTEEVRGTLFDWTTHSPPRNEITEFTGSKQAVSAAWGDSFDAVQFVEG